jgi:hypothetical protein
MKNSLTKALLSLFILAPLYAGGEKEKPFSLKEFAKKNAANKQAHEQKQRDFQEKTILSSDKAAQNVLESSHEKYAQEIKKLLQEHSDITQKMNRDRTEAKQQSDFEKEVALLVTISSKNRPQPKRTPTKPTKIEKSMFVSIQQPQGVPTCYNPEQPDDLRCLYCLNEVFIKDAVNL